MIPSDLARQDFCYLSTTGRVTGRTHTIEIWFAAEGDTLYLLSGGGDRADWVRNAIADPSVRVRVGDTVWAGRAEVVRDPVHRSRPAGLVHDKYAPTYSGSLTGWRDSALLVAVTVGGPIEDGDARDGGR